MLAALAALGSLLLAVAGGAPAIELVEELAVSLHGGGPDGGLSPAWEAEIACRLRKVESGEATYVSGEDVFAEADEIIRAARGAR